MHRRAGYPTPAEPSSNTNTFSSSLLLQMEDECRLSSVDDIAAAVHEILAKISDECAASHLLAA